MITNKELDDIRLSPTKKDYYQIWSELLDLATKISTIYNPKNANESDPGVVLLKALTSIAEKLTYNTDKGIAEIFMPSATQEASMRKLTNMLGYTMKYYRAATTTAEISYKASNDVEQSEVIFFPKFVNLKNDDETVNYVTTQEFYLSPETVYSVPVIEGTLVECESDNDNIITALQLDDNNRYFLPETSVAENGIFVTNISNNTESGYWDRVDNLNTQLLGSRVFKFDFDSRRNLPYIQFPTDISHLIEDGLKISYIRTNGYSGNINARTLSKFEVPGIWSGDDTSEFIKNLTTEMFDVVNTSAATNGTNPEGLTQTYNNFKKTVGTFDTLVTCRDYMNRIYQMTVSDINTTPLVSNVVVSDIRDDINKSTRVCTFNEYGVCYSDRSFKKADKTDLISHFDLYMYPMTPVYGFNTKKEFDDSFKFNASNKLRILNQLDENKTIAHNIKLIDDNNDVAFIKNYLRLKAKIQTSRKVTSAEETEILGNIFSALYENFNARKVDFGESIPYDSIEEVIENADARIKYVSLDEPTLDTRIVYKDNSELDLNDTSSTSVEDQTKVNDTYNKLVLKNILAGKIAAFDYDTSFEYNYTDTKYEFTDTSIQTKLTNPVSKIVSHFDLPSNAWEGASGYTLGANEVVQFSAPNLKTLITYPAYVNYFFYKANKTNNSVAAIPAVFITLGEALSRNAGALWIALYNEYKSDTDIVKPVSGIISSATFTSAIRTYGALFDSKNQYAIAYTSGETYKAIDLSVIGLGRLNTFVRTNYYSNPLASNSVLYKNSGTNLQYHIPGYLVDANYNKYVVINTSNSLTNWTTQLYVADNTAAEEGFGKNGTAPTGLGIDTEYMLEEGDYLLINYTNTVTDDAGNEKTVVYNIPYTAGTMIKANFDLIDSRTYHGTHKYTKQSGFNFSQLGPDEGMFTLGTNEQICIRDFISVILDSPTANLYWELQTDDSEASSNSFKFNETWSDGTTTYKAYTLKDGEYFYYSDAKKSNFAYYGRGTVIVDTAATGDTEALNLKKYTLDGEATSEEIMTYGLAASIPWVPKNLSDHKLKIIEQQYITLTEGDTLLTLNGASGTIAELTNSPVICTSASYRFAENSTEEHLPALSLTNSTTLNNSNSWSVRTRLDFNLNSSSGQELGKYDSFDVYLGTTASTDPVVVKSNATGNLVTIYSNYLCQLASDTFYFTSDIIDWKLNACAVTAVELKNTAKTVINLNNYSENWTKVNYSDFTADQFDEEHKVSFDLNISIPNKKVGFIMFYHKINEELKTTGSTESTGTITITAVGGKIKDLSNSNNVYTNSITLNTDTICQIIIEADVSKITITGDAANILVFSKLSVASSVNPKLDYRFSASANTDLLKIDRLIAAIQATDIASDFYYSAPISSDNAIDINPLITTEKLSSPEIWYDHNNVCNKFVISEIDSDYLVSGITLTKSSRR